MPVLATIFVLYGQMFECIPTFDLYRFSSVCIFSKNSVWIRLLHPLNYYNRDIALIGMTLHTFFRMRIELHVLVHSSIFMISVCLVSYIRQVLMEFSLQSGQYCEDERRRAVQSSRSHHLFKKGSSHNSSFKRRSFKLNRRSKESDSECK